MTEQTVHLPCTWQDLADLRHALALAAPQVDYETLLRFEALEAVIGAMHQTLPNPLGLAKRDGLVRADEAKRLLRERAWPDVNALDPVSEEEMRIHCRLGGIGADWWLTDALALVDTAEEIGWCDPPSIFGHDLAVISSTLGRRGVYCFDVPRPKS